jgi:hypothetical protein
LAKRQYPITFTLNEDDYQELSALCKKLTRTQYSVVKRLVKEGVKASVQKLEAAEPKPSVPKLR